MAAATSGPQLSPWTRTGQTMTWRGKRSSSRCRMSRITAPVGEVTTPITPGRKGSFLLRSTENNPSAASATRRASISAMSAPIPAGSIVSMTSWYLDWPGKVVIRPVATTSSPWASFTRSFEAVARHTMPARQAPSSFRSR